jgi:hypothetical protein
MFILEIHFNQFPKIEYSIDFQGLGKNLTDCWISTSFSFLEHLLWFIHLDYNITTNSSYTTMSIKTYFQVFS